MKEYSYEDILGFLRATVAERGEDFTYEPHRLENGNIGCYYHREGQADCGIGKMLHDHLNVPITLLQDMDAAGDVIGGQYGLLLQNGITFDRAARILMEHFQSNQDNSVPWGEALTAAVHFAERFRN